ncbi:cation transporter E1-E2 family ATPase [Streptococcus varani]|uniref:Cation transporter E1-E2 family ATPase n=1 Tax=Streptococcus varani TaxID=1608583 RepID=A0A0E4CTN2_9STRE|nr:HAD-IC family P-type ATPase [Streptococcus varani]CQR25946.1 cation transporter E1-E2 family ATPase [Streptococcus varani]
MKKVYQKSLEEVYQNLGSSEQGLDDRAVKERQEKYGLNELVESEGLTPWQILWHNINNIIVYLLTAVSIISLFMNEYVEAMAVFVALLIAVLTGFFVEMKAQASVNALQNMIFTTMKVRRNGDLKEIMSSEIVPGDIIVLEEGDAIAADARLISATNFAVIEAALTGESEAVEKSPTDDFDQDLAIGDRTNMVFSGTAVARGNALALVTGTGMETEVGQISALIDNGQVSSSPLDIELKKLGRILIFVAFLAALIVVLVGFMTGQDLIHVAHIAIILAVAAIPEALPAVSTITLSRGMKIMSDHKALVKSLSAVETLGSTTVIASDKTGTLTENQMTAEMVYLPEDQVVAISGTGYQPEGDFTIDGEKQDSDFQLTLDQPSEHDALTRFVLNGLLASNAQLRQADEQSEDNDKVEYEIIGDPTEGALVVLAAKAGLTRPVIDQSQWEKVAEVPFSSEKKYMVVHYEGPQNRVIVKGAPDVLMRMFVSDKQEENYWSDQNEEIAGKGMRVLAVASLDLDASQSVQGDLDDFVSSHKENFVLDGLVGIVDPPRQDVKEAVRLTQGAGIQVKMITGDHPKTASIIAQQIGIENAENTMTGLEIDKAVNQPDFAEKVQETAVFARVSPENKLQIVQALQGQDEVVAMTGDGVNDAPALNGAEIGVAMGIRGTEVAKESSDMILTDDRFSTIVDAVEIGRIIFANIKKYVAFLFSCNMVEILTVLMTFVFILPMPIQALHILFLNLVIDIGPALALAFESSEEDIMNKPPRDAKGGLVSKKFLSQIIVNGALIAIASFIVFNIAYTNEASLEYAQTATFTFMAMAQLFHVFNIRKEKGFGIDKSLFQNKILLLALAISFTFQLAVVYLPFWNNILDTQPLTAFTWGYMTIALLITTALVYVSNKLMRRYFN